MQPDRLNTLLDGFSRQRIAVLGDFFLDKYLEVDATLAEPSLETGRVAHQVVGVRRSPGAAGTVVNNLAALGAGSFAARRFRFSWIRPAMLRGPAPTRPKTLLGFGCKYKQNCTTSADDIWILAR